MSTSTTPSTKAAVTRTRLVECARTLFLTQGYAATTTRQVAAAAHVTERTLFNVLATKSELLREVLLTYVFTDDDAPLLHRQDFHQVLAADTVAAFLDRYTRWVADLHRRTSAVAEMTRAAASVDAGAAEIYAWGNARQVDDLEALAGVLARRRWLQPSESARDVARSLAVLCGHEAYWRLVTEQRWSLSSYRRWLHRHCACELDASAAPTTAVSRRPSGS